MAVVVLVAESHPDLDVFLVGFVVFSAQLTVGLEEQSWDSICGDGVVFGGVFLEDGFGEGEVVESFFIEFFFVGGCGL